MGDSSQARNDRHTSTSATFMCLTFLPRHKVCLLVSWSFAGLRVVSCFLRSRLPCDSGGVEKDAGWKPATTQVVALASSRAFRC